eukprot:1159853-Pelagomonas_calceolata.AAC.2
MLKTARCSMMLERNTSGSADLASSLLFGLEGTALSSRAAPCNGCLSIWQEGGAGGAAGEPFENRKVTRLASADPRL